MEEMEREEMEREEREREEMERKGGGDRNNKAGRKNCSKQGTGDLLYD